MVKQQLSDLLWLLVKILRNTEKIMSAQDDINTAVSTITGLLTDIQGQVATLATDLQQIQAELAGQGVDTTALNSVVSTVAGIQSSLDQGVEAVTSVASPPPST